LSQILNAHCGKKPWYETRDNAVKNYKEVEAETARGQKKDSTPTVAEDKRIKQQMADDKQDADNARGATSGFTTRDRVGEKLFAKGGSIRGGGM
jgi:hypothetical protein